MGASYTFTEKIIENVSLNEILSELKYTMRKMQMLPSFIFIGTRSME